MSEALSENRKAYFLYDIIENFEAGIELKGYEVKAVKTGRANIAGSFATVHDNQIWLTGANIQPYQAKNTPPEYDPTHSRRLLLNRKEIAYLIGKMHSDRLTLVPLKLYNKAGRIKVELGLARGKRQFEKRETIKKRETNIEIRRSLKS
jgi:SsrA-binding protein